MAKNSILVSALVLAFAATAEGSVFAFVDPGNLTATEGQLFTEALHTANGTSPTTLCFAPSNQPVFPVQGLTLVGTSCTITGTPTTPGTYTVTVDGANGGATAQITIHITVNAATTPPPTTTPQFVYLLPHWAAFGGWVTLWSIVDTSLAPNQCGIELIGPDGQPISLETTAGTGNFIGPIDIAPWGTLEIVAGSPGGSVTSGASTVACIGSANVSETYTFVDASGIKQTAVSVLPTVAGSNAVFQANAFTGVAVWNSHPTKSLGTTVYTYDVNGNLVGTAAMTVPPLSKSIFNLNQVIKPALATTFVGSAQVVGDNRRMHVVVVGVQGNGAGGFTTFNDPVMSSSTPFSSYSGVYSVPNGQTGSLLINNLVPAGNGPDTIFFAGTAVSGSSSGPVTAIYNPRDGKLYLDFGVMGGSTPGALSNAAAALTQESDASFAGSLYTYTGPTTIKAGSLTLDGGNEIGVCYEKLGCNAADKIGPAGKAQCKQGGNKSWLGPGGVCVSPL